MIVLDKATGRIADVGWTDLYWMLKPGSGIYLERLAETKNPFEVIQSPRRSSADLSAGEHLFAQQCSSCHGDAGAGGAGGPSLHDRIFRNGRSDWALYETIVRGIPGTAMVGRNLPRDDVWRLVTYLGHIIGSPDRVTSDGQLRPVVPPVDATDLLEAERHPDDWLTYSGSYSGQRHSALTQIDRANVNQLGAAWIRQLSTSDDRIETSPIVRGSTMFVTEPPNRVLALNAASGSVLWTYSRELPQRLNLCCGSVNRGAAVLGNLVFVGTLDAHLVALDASTGRVAWDVAVGDYSRGYSITGTPLAIGDMVVVGVAGGEFAIRGFIDAYDAASGKRRWRFYTVPADGEPGSETWPKDSLQRGGAPTWLIGSYDPALRLIYWGVGNPSPNFYGADRNGDNLYSNSVVALDADTGKLRWHFQFTPHDLHDWDSVQIPVLVDVAGENTTRKLLAWANRNAFYYLLDRETGKFLLGTPFAKQTWADGLDPDGRPRVRPESIPTHRGVIVYPSDIGATNWWSPSYDPDLRLLYVPTLERPGLFYASADRPPANDGQILGSQGQGVPGESFVTVVKALDVSTGQLRWQYQHPARSTYAITGGLLSTAGKLVFGGDEDIVFALDAEKGTKLWSFAAGGRVISAPVTYAVDGRQYVTLAAGRSILTFALPQSVISATAAKAPQ